MENENTPKTRADFSTDSEWYTYKITHPEEFENQDDIKDGINDNTQEETYPLIIVQCLKCGYIIDENELNPLPDEKVPYDKRLKCPKCKNCTKFKAIKNKEEKEKIIKAQKEKEKKEKDKKLKYIKITVLKIKKELEELKNELDELLNNNEITPERYAALMINLTFNIYKYYRYDDRMEMFFSDFRDYAYSVTDNVLKNYYQAQELDDKLNEMLLEYDKVKEFDLIYLNHSLEYAKEAEVIADSSDIEVNKIEVESDLNRLQYQIEQQEKYNENVKELLEKDKERRNDIDELTFFKDLKRINGI